MVHLFTAEPAQVSASARPTVFHFNQSEWCDTCPCWSLILKLQSTSWCAAVEALYIRKLWKSFLSIIILTNDQSDFIFFLGVDSMKKFVSMRTFILERQKRPMHTVILLLFLALISILIVKSEFELFVGSVFALL